MINSPKSYRDLQPLRELILPLYAPCLFFSLGIGAALLILPLFAIELGGSVALSGLVLGLKGAGTLLANLPAGILVSRLGEKYALIFAATLLLLTSLFATEINSIVSLFICSVIMGSAVSVWFLARLKYISDHIPQKILGRAMVILSCVEKLGLLFGPLIAGYLIQRFSHGVAFHISATMGLTALLLVHCFATKGRSYKPPPHSIRRFRVIVDILSRHKRLFTIVGSVIVIMLLLKTAKLTILPIWALSISLDAAQIGLVVFAAGCAELLMFVPAALILDLWGRKWSAGLSLLFFSLAFTLLPLAGSFGTLIAAAAVMGLADGLSTGWGNTLITDLSPAENRAGYFGIWRTIGDFGTLSGPLLVGFLAAAISIPATSLVIAGIGLGGAALLVTKVRETRLE
jgi:MFS family permease